MKLKLEWNHLTITIQAESDEAMIDAIMTGASCLKTLKELGYGNPKTSLDFDEEKSER